MEFAKIIALVVVLSTGSAAVAQTETIWMRTQLVGQNVVGFTSDGRAYAITCKHKFGGFFNSAAFLFPNKQGDLTVDDYENKRGHPDKSSYVTLDDATTKRICNEPNGYYSFRLTKDDYHYKKVELLEGSTLDGDAGSRSRGFY